MRVREPLSAHCRTQRLINIGGADAPAKASCAEEIRADFLMRWIRWLGRYCRRRGWGSPQGPLSPRKRGPVKSKAER